MPNPAYFSDPVMQKCALRRVALKMLIVLGLQLCNFLFNSARIIHANTYDMRDFLFLILTECRTLEYRCLQDLRHA